MAISIDNQSAYHALNDAVRVHVADIKNDLTLNDTSSKYIEGVVQLVWPFSSTTSQLSLLLIEKDVSLREVTAQIRITFHDACAKEVAQSKIGIGDTLKLNLKGAFTEAEHEELSTPGKKTGYDLHFRKSVSLHAFTYDNQNKILDFVAPVAPKVLNGTHSTPKTPFRNSNIDISKTRLSSATSSSKRKPRISLNSFPGSQIDPFSEDDGYIEGHGRKRTKFARSSNRWRLADASDEESESRAEEAEDVSTPSQVVTEPEIQIAPVVDLRDTSAIDISMSAEEGQEPLQPSHIEEYNDAEHEPRNLKVISIDEEEPTAHVQKVERTAITEDLPAIEEPVSTSQEPQIPVERITPDRATTISIQNPMLTALASPGLPLVSPLMFRTNGFSAHAQVTVDPDAGIQTSDKTSAHDPSLDHHESYYFPYIAEPILQPQPTATEAAESPIVNTQQLRVLPATTTEEAEVDLDKLQEQIDMSNADFVPEVLEQVIEDEDMYGPPRDREVGMNLQHLEDIRSRISTEEPEGVPLDPELAAFANQPPVNDDIWGGFDGTYAAQNIVVLDPVSTDIPRETSITEQVAFQPYPFHFENQIEVAEHVSDEGDNGFEKPGPISSISEPMTEPLQSLDGASPLINGDSPRSAGTPLPDEIDVVHVDRIRPLHEMEQPPMPVVHIATSVEDTMDGTSPASAHHVVLDSSSIIQQVEGDKNELDPSQAQWAIHEPYLDSGSKIPTNAFTPEATQVAGMHAIDDTVIDNRTHVHLPPTPIESQMATSQQDAVEKIPASQVEQPAPDYMDITPIRPPAGQIIRDRDDDEGIASPYFTSHTSLLMPSTAMDSIKVPASSRMRLRSSSPADFPVDHLESERLVAIEVSMNETTNMSSEDQFQPEAKGGIATPLEYYAHLNTLSEYYNRQVDIMAVCSADSVAPERAKSGPKDFFTTIQLVDRSVQETSTTITAQIFRPRKTAIPIVRRGDILLLRRFKVQTKSRKPMLLSTDESAWAVYRCNASSDENGAESVEIVDTPIVTGPPVEHGPFEADNASRLLRWWQADGSKHQFEATTESSPVKTTETAKSGRPRKPIPVPTDLRRSPRKTRKTGSVDASQTPMSPTFQPESPEVLHMTIVSPQSHASLQSPTSVRSTRSQTAPIKLQTKPADTAPLTSSPAKPRPRAAKQSTPSSPNTEPSTIVIPAFPNTASRNISSNNSVTSSVTETSGSSKRRRYERRSTSLVHRLRDGTEWVDIEQEEIFSVTESDSDGGSDGDGDDGSVQAEVDDDSQGQGEDRDPTDAIQVEAQDRYQTHPAIHEAAESQAGNTRRPETEIGTDTPSRKPRGRPRRIPNPDLDPSPTVAFAVAATVPEDNTNNLPRTTRARTRSAPPEPEIETAEDTIVITEASDPLAPSPSSPVVESAGQNGSQSQSQSQSPVQGRMTRSQAANLRGTG